jgi:hypothetical protein
MRRHNVWNKLFYLVATVLPSDAQTILQAAVVAVKQKPFIVTAAKGYTGSLTVIVPPGLQDVLGLALNSGGSGYRGYIGVYNLTNEVVTILAAGGKASGNLTMLLEPKNKMPSSVSDAKTQLSTLFPGISAPLAQVQAAANVYAFYGNSGGAAYCVEFVSYQDVPRAYAMVGSGSYQSLVPKQKNQYIKTSFPLIKEKRYNLA